MKIGNVTINKNLGGMVIPGREQLLYAIKRFAQLHIPGSFNDRKPVEVIPSFDTPQQAAKYHATLLRIRMQNDRRMREEFESNWIPIINDALTGSEFFYHSFPDEFDFSPIRSTTISAKDLKDSDGNHLLLLNNGYLGHRIEEPLAETLGLERELLDLSVEVPLPVDGDKFEFDFDKLLTPLRDVDSLDLGNISGKGAADFFMTEPFYYFPLKSGEHTLYMHPTHVGGGHLEPREPWSQDGAVLRGPLFNGHWGNQDGVNIPVMQFYITNGTNSQWNPFLDQENKQKAEALAQAVADKITQAYT